LARREHSRQELHDKLITRGFSASLVEEVLRDLIEEGLQSDQRYAESYTCARLNKGFGPLRIRHDLKHRGVATHLIDQAMSTVSQAQWAKRCQQVWQKKFGTVAENFEERMKQQHFLRYRGFDHEQIVKVIRHQEDCHENQ